MLILSFPFNLFFLSTLIVGSLISISSRNWIIVWVGLELNLYSFIPLITSLKWSRNEDRATQYFIVQAVGSGLIVIGFFSRALFSYTNLILTIALILKAGIAPLHFWLPAVAKSLRWKSFLLLFSIQKLAPILLLISIITTQYSFIIPFIIISAIVGGIGGQFQSKIRFILTFSSIGHSGWILAASIVNQYIAKTYLILYLIINSIIIIPLIIISTHSSIKNNSSAYLIIGVILIRLSGIPPTLGFFIKISVAIALLKRQNLWILIILFLSSIIHLAYYLALLNLIFINTKTLKPKYNLFTSLLLYIILLILITVIGAIPLIISIPALLL